MNLRRDIQGMFAYPTLVIFCEGKAGIAAAKALIEATPDSGGLNFPLRQDVRMYYRVSLGSASLSLSLSHVHTTCVLTIQCMCPSHKLLVIDTSCTCCLGGCCCCGI